MEPWSGGSLFDALIREAFGGVVQRSGNAAPGPDGVPLQLGGVRVRRHEVRWAAWSSRSWRGCALRQSLGDSRMVFIPHVRESMSLGSGRVVAAAGDLRPLILSNAGKRFVASFASVVLWQAGAVYCTPAQFGFVAERQSVLLLEAPELRDVRCSNDGGLIFVDVRVAFPSVRHRWIGMGLQHIRLPEPLRRLSDSLYRARYVAISVAAAAPMMIHMRCGIRQCCPASG